MSSARIRPTKKAMRELEQRARRAESDSRELARRLDLLEQVRVRFLPAILRELARGADKNGCVLVDPVGWAAYAGSREPFSPNQISMDGASMGRGSGPVACAFTIFPAPPDLPLGGGTFDVVRR